MSTNRIDKPTPLVPGAATTTAPAAPLLPAAAREASRAPGGPAADATDALVQHAGPAPTLTRAPDVAAAALQAPSPGGVGTRPSGATGPYAAASAAAAAPLPAFATRWSPVPPDYRVPAGTELSTPTSLGERLLNGVGLLFLAPFYLALAGIALIPSIIGGAVAAPKEDQCDGSGTFMSGFANVFRSLVGWVNKPLYKLIFGSFGPQRSFFVDRVTDPDNVIITVRIRLTGDPSHVLQVKALEDEVEVHLAVPGYRVNVEFVEQEGSGVVTIPIDPTVWSNSFAWNPLMGDNAIDSWDVPMIAHELMHTPLGLPDEYSLQQHFTNEQMGFRQRLGAFLHRLVQPEPPPDHAAGIMGAEWEKPLARHYEAILRSVD